MDYGLDWTGLEANKEASRQAGEEKEKGKVSVRAFPVAAAAAAAAAAVQCHSLECGVQRSG